MVAYHGTSVTITRSDFEAKESSVTGGGIYIQGEAASPATMTLDDTLFFDNTGQYAGPLGLLGYAAVTFSGTTATDSGAHANSTTTTLSYDGAVLVQGTDSSFTCDGCDMGDSGTTDDSDPEDVSCYDGTSTSNHSYGDDETFECDPTGCF